MVGVDLAVGRFIGLECRFDDEQESIEGGWLALHLVLVPKSGPPIKLARATCYDADGGGVSLTLFEEELPVPLVLKLIDEVKRRAWPVP